MDLTFFQALGAIITLFTLFGGAYVGLRKVGPGNTQSISDAAGKVSAAAVDFIEAQRTEIASQRAEIAELRGRLVSLENEVHRARLASERLIRVEQERDAAENAAEILLDRIEELVQVLKAHAIEPPPEVIHIMWRRNGHNDKT